MNNDGLSNGTWMDQTPFWNDTNMDPNADGGHDLGGGVPYTADIHEEGENASNSNANPAVSIERPIGVPYNISALSGKAYVEELMRSSSDKFKDTLRMPKQAFVRLCGTLRDNGILRDDGRAHVLIEEAVCIWVYIAVGNSTQRRAEDRFQHSLETINRQFRRVTVALCHLGRHIIRPYNNNPHHSIMYNRRLNPWFEKCIGAIDDTFIRSIMPKVVHQACRHRKGEIGHTLMAVVDHDLIFTWVFSGFEASGHDGGVFKHVTDPLYRFPIPPPGCFYVADSAFTNLKEVWTPFNGKNYQRSDFIGNPPKNEYEMFNFRHASIRNVVERAFGVLKNRFIILKLMGKYEPHFQARIVIACVCMHNYIRLYGGLERDFFPDAILEPTPLPEGPPNASDIIDQSPQAISSAYEMREGVARSLYGDALYYGFTH